MNPPSDMKTDLTIEERALAQRLARLGPHGEPSPALDARILAAAHDAVARTQARRQRRRWPVAFGIAASLALAVGIAWQLRPLPQAAVDQSEAPAAMSVQTTSQPAAAADSSMESATAAADATAIKPQGDAAATASMPAPEASRESAKTMKSAAPAPPLPVEQSPVEPDIVLDNPEPATEAAAQSAPVAAPRAFSMQPPPAVPATSAKRQSAAEEADAAANALPETDTLDRLQATGTAEAAANDEPGTDVPPATMTSPEARDAWLARIRELLVAGKLDAARASLGEFRHRYPDAPLPDDLRALGQ
jgi:hypothetical protein